jgi:hypothetical protein
MAPKPSKAGDRLENNYIYLDDLEISVRRTVRVPDTENMSKLPPDLGAFPLFQTKYFAEAMGPEMASKGGLFFPMYPKFVFASPLFVQLLTQPSAERKAMWIDISAEKRYAIKIFVSGVNAISGKPEVATSAIIASLKEKVLRGETIQDYIVAPDQYLLDSVAIVPGEVRQFVAMPMRSGHSVEAQMTG